MAILVEKNFSNNKPYIISTVNDAKKLERRISKSLIFLIFFLIYLVIIPLLVIITFFIGMTMLPFIILKIIFLIAIIGTIYWNLDTIRVVITHL